MLKCIKAVLAAGLVLSFISAPAQATTLTPTQCAKLKIELDKYIGYAQSTIVAAQKVYAKTCPNGPVNSKCTKLKADLDKFIAGVNWAIAEAKAIYDKKCPAANPLVECIVMNNTGFANLALGVDLTGALSNNSTQILAPVCVSANACANIISTKFTVTGQSQSTRCNPPDATVVPLTDAEVQTKINAIP